MANPFVHVELNSTDVDRSKSFYTQLFDWKLQDVEMSPGMTYTTIGVGEGTGGGMMKQLIPGAPSFWLSYVLVDDIDAATRKAEALGAKVMKDVTEVMGMGRLSILVDPTGAAFGLWQPKSA
jgi:predicted enzyme related to lactoylglutathione lyase